MTVLHLRLTHDYLDTSLSAAAVAKVRWLARSDGTPPKTWWSAEKPIAAAPAGAADFTPFDLPDGGYFAVDVVRPRGRTISNEVFVETGATKTETIDLGASPHEYLSWQQLAGIVPRKLDLGLDLIGSSMSDEPPNADLRTPTSADSVGWDLLVDPAGRRRPREDRPALAMAGAAVPPGIGGRPFARQADDGRFATWFLNEPDPPTQLGLQMWLTSGKHRLEPSTAPRWLLIDVDRMTDLVSVPWGWWTAFANVPSEPIRILHDRLAFGDEARRRGRTTISVRDDRWFPLLEFLASGRLLEAGSIVDAVIDQDELIEALKQKLKGPLVAAAAAIILLARTQTIERQGWDGWLDNLANWFPAIPDGKILLGCRRLQQAGNRDGVRRAFDLLKEGFQRGIPFFSMSIRMLSLALAQLADEFEEAEVLRRRMGQVAARVDPNQPFTVIHWRSDDG